MKSLHILTVGNNPLLVRILWSRIAARGGFRMSHLAHPSFDQSSWPRELCSNEVHFFRDDIRSAFPPADVKFLASLERDAVPTIHNMIMSDRLASKLPREDVLAYASFLAKRLVDLFEGVAPTLIIGAFDGLHSSLGFAVANYLGIPWFVPLFSPLPGGEASFCANLSPASRVIFDPNRAAELHANAEAQLVEFENRKMSAVAYIPPRLFSAAFVFKRIPAQFAALIRVLPRRRLKKFLQFTDFPQTYSIRKLAGEAFRQRRNLWLLRRRKLLREPTAEPFVFFGLHMQPESSIDVFAHFFSNQERVIELIARSVPPTHSVLVKLHKSDTLNYSTQQLARLSRFPGVKLVSPYADTFEFIKKAALVFAIQGTIGLEGALLGKPVIMFGNSAVQVFSSVSTVGKTVDLPVLVRSKLAEPQPSRSQIIEGFAAYLAPFYPATGNDWSLMPTDAQIDDYVKLIGLLTQRAAPELRSLPP
jgi:hypothetical protein